MKESIDKTIKALLTYHKDKICEARGFINVIPVNYHDFRNTLIKYDICHNDICFQRVFRELYDARLIESDHPGIKVFVLRIPPEYQPLIQQLLPPTTEEQDTDDTDSINQTIATIEHHLNEALNQLHELKKLQCGNQ